MQAKLDEVSLRRPDFRMGTPVVLADGQEWHLRAPVVIFEACEKSPSGWRTALSVEPNDDYQDHLDRYYDLIHSEKPTLGDLFPAEFALGKRLLEANYDLEPSQTRDLLKFVYNDASGHPFARVRDDVLEVAMGNGPKPSSDGDESSPTPSGESPSTPG